jgi:hypothetical protein
MMNWHELDRAISPFTIEAEGGREEARWKKRENSLSKRGIVEILGTIWRCFIKDKIKIAEIFINNVKNIQKYENKI